MNRFESLCATQLPGVIVPVLATAFLGAPAAAQETIRVSVSSTGEQGNGASGSFIPVAISADGRFVAFTSEAPNLVPGDTNLRTDIFVHDLQTGETTRVSVSSTGEQGNGASFSPSMSGDGRFVAYSSDASNLVPGDTIGVRDVFVHDRQTGETTRASVASTGAQGNGFSGSPCLSADGRFVAFESRASNLVPTDTNGDSDVFVHDRLTGETALVSVSSTGVQAAQFSMGPSISGDGRFVAFHTGSTNLVPGDTNGSSDAFVHDRQTGETTRVNVTSTGAQSNGSTFNPSLSADGTLVAFDSDASNLVPGDTNGRFDVFVHHLQTGDTTRVSLSSAGVQGNRLSAYSALSGDGRLVTFPSDASNLVPGDTNAASDVFIRDLRDPLICRAGRINAGAGPVANVLFLNGSAGDVNREVSVPASAPIELGLLASPSGPDPARYVVWVWPFFPSGSLDVRAGGQVLGCTANPTPLKPLATPQPFRCLRGMGIPAAACGNVTTVASPSRAPWTVTIGRGIPSPSFFTLQGVLEDAGAANGTGFSVTNAVLLRVE